MRSVLLIILLALILSIPVMTIAGPDEATGELVVTMEIEGMT